MKPILKITLITLVLGVSVKTFAQAPNINYSDPYTFSVGTTVNVSPTNSGGTISINGQTTTIAGTGSAGYVNGVGTVASFNQPLGAVVDASGNIYVTDVGNEVIRKIAPNGTVTTFAGTGSPGSADGTGTAASFYHPVGMCIDASGNIYIADEDNNMIRKMTPAGVVTTVAGQTGAGYVDGAASVAKFNLPCGVAVDAAGNLYVADNNNNRIRKITPSGTVSTFAGSGTAAYADGQGTAASFNQPFSVTIDASGNLYVADRYNHRIRKITSGGLVSTLAGSGTLGYAEGTGTAAMFNYPTTVTVDKLGNVYVADYHNNRVRKVTSGGVVTTLSGTGVAGSTNDIGTASTFNYPFAVALDAAANVIVCDLNTNLIRKVVSTPYTLSGTLPAGLSFNSATGAITGTPTTITAATNYSVTAYSLLSNSNSTTSINIGIDAAGSVNPSGGYNFVATYIPRVSGLVTSGDLGNAALDKTKVEAIIQYLDGMGRPIQSVQAKASPQGYDIVQPVAYDQYGREVTKYLPYAPQAGQYGDYRPNAVSTDQASFYTSPPSGSGVSAITDPYSQTAFDNSPLNRILEQGAPGVPWQLTGVSGGGHTNKFIYTTNNSITWAADSVHSMQVARYDVMINSDQSRTLTANGFYNANTLLVTITKDENWVSGRAGTTEEYKDLLGRVILKRLYNYSTSASLTALSTYYVYDDLGNLAFVLPPAANGDADAAISTTTLNNLGYQYRYDQRNRLVQKKIPGKGWEFTVYNTLDQVVMTQDANQRALSTQQWAFNKYDVQGRTIVTGLYTDAGTAGDINANAPSTARLTYFTGVYANINNTKWEAWTGTTTTGYDGLSNPTGQSYTNLVINFYDKYPGSTYISSGYSAPSGASLINTGLKTGSLTNVLGTNTMLSAVDYYDVFGRIIKTYQQHYLGATASANNYDAITTTYNFVNQPTTVTRQHWTTSSTLYPLVTIANTFYYDHKGRKRSIWEQITNGNSAPTTKTLVSKVDYNEMGQLLNKHLHSTVDSLNGTGYMQNIAYTYNERGWLFTSSAPLFAMSLFYNTAGAYQQFNGNIVTQYWGTPGNLNNHYSYNYDKLDRMTSGSSTIGSEQNIAYDMMGNLTTLRRYDNSSILIDNLSYNYTGNQLNSVADASGSNSGLPNLTTNYTYDGNGNMLTQTNANNTASNKTITYSLLNLPKFVTVPTGSVTYTYDAIGQKLRKVAVINGVTTNTEYISGIQYKNSTTAIDFIQTEEGRAVPNGASYDYIYYLADNLGNTRRTFGTKTGAAVLYQSDDYYPFGMEINNSVTSPKNEYLYNKKELQEELSEYDYGARFYDPVIGRWNVIDHKAEWYFQFSPYVYAANTPPNAIDPNGHLVIFIAGQNAGNGGSSSYWSHDIYHMVDGGVQDYYSSDNFDDNIMTHFKDHNSRYYDGAMGGWSNTFFMLWAAPVDNLWLGSRTAEGHRQGKLDVASIIKHLRRTHGVITESIKIIAHSMGAAYAKGFIEAIVEYAQTHPKECAGLSITEYDFAAYQQNDLSAIPGVPLYQFDNKGDLVVGNGITSHHAKEKGRQEKGSNDNVNPSGGHSIIDFMSIITSLEEGTYKFINGKFVKQPDEKKDN